MSNSTKKTAIANIGMLAIGQKEITALTDTTDPMAIKLNAIFESVVEELLGHDWHFNRKRVLLSDMTKVNKLTLDASPTPAAFSPGATLTGVTSTNTCTVLEQLSSTVYLVTEPSGDFTDGEVIGDGTNSRNTASGYPKITDDLDHAQYPYGYVLPTDQVYVRGVGDVDFDEIKYPHVREGSILFTDRTDDYFHYNKYIGEAGSLTVTDVTAMPLWFHRLISARLAYLLSPNVTENTRIRPKAELDLRAAWLNAREKNGEEAYSEYEQGNTDWADGANAELP